MGNDLDRVIEEETCKKQVTLNGRKFIIGKLGLVQQTELINFCVQVILRFRERLTKIDTTGDNWLADAYNILAILPPEEIAQLCSLLLDTKDVEFCKTLGADDITEIIATILENNDIERIVKNVFRVVRIVKKINLKELLTP